MTSMDEKATLVALNPQYEAWSEFTVVRRDLMTIWFLSGASAPGGTWVLEFIRWWEPDAKFPADKLGRQMRESILTGELDKVMWIHINPFANQVSESQRMTLLFRELNDFILHSGGFEVRGNDDGECGELIPAPA